METQVKSPNAKPYSWLSLYEGNYLNGNIKVADITTIPRVELSLYEGNYLNGNFLSFCSFCSERSFALPL